MSDRDWRTTFTETSAQPVSAGHERIWREVFGHQYPEGLDIYTRGTTSLSVNRSARTSGRTTIALMDAPMGAEAGSALDGVDRFIEVAMDLARQPDLSAPRYAGAVARLVEVVQLLLVANENMARWLNRFTQFDFRAQDSRGRFLDLVGEYNTAKSGPQLRQMKWPCGEILAIYDEHIRPSMADLFVQTERVSDRLDRAFSELGTADDDMVAFIYDTVVGGIDRFLSDAEPAVDGDDLDTAERARLDFKVRARQLTERLERLGGGLAEVVLRYSTLAGRPVTLPR